MDFWLAIVIIVAITSGAKVLRARSIAQAQFGASRADPAATDALAREVASLNARVQVLERILTDTRGSHDLAREIDALRDR